MRKAPKTSQETQKRSEGPFRTGRQIYDQIRWDRRFDTAACWIEMQERFSGSKRVPFDGFDPEEVPWHRIERFEYNGVVIWDRAARIDRLAEIAGQDAPSQEAIVPLATHEGEEPLWVTLSRQHLKGLSLRARRCYRFVPTSGRWLPWEGTLQQISEDGAFRAATWNVLAGRYAAGGDQAQKRYAQVIEVLEGCGADLIGLQEVEPALVRMLLRQPWVRKHYWVSEDETAQGLGESIGQLLLMRRPFVLQDLRFSGEKHALIAQFALGGKLSFAACVHLSSDFARMGRFLRSLQLHVLCHTLAWQSAHRTTRPRSLNREEILSICAQEWAIIQQRGFLFGDLNEDPRDAFWHALLEIPEEFAHVDITQLPLLWDAVEQAGFVDCWPMVEMERPGESFDPLHNPLASALSVSGRSRRLDALWLVDPDASVMPMDIQMFGFPSIHAKGGLLARDYASDHFGLSASFSVPPDEATEEALLATNETQEASEASDVSEVSKLSKLSVSNLSEASDVSEAPDGTKFSESSEASDTPKASESSDTSISSASREFVASAPTKTDREAETTLSTNTATMQQAAFRRTTDLGERLAKAPPTYHSALIVMPPPDVWEAMQAIRQKHDKSYARWMPHINLVYGFVDRVLFPDAVKAIQEAVAKVQPFAVTCSQIRSFRHGKSDTIWLEPSAQPQRALHRLQATLQSLFPLCNEQVEKSNAGYTPHLTLGQLRGDARGDLQKTVQSWQQGWQPIRFVVDHVALICRDGEAPFRVEERVFFRKDRTLSLEEPRNKTTAPQESISLNTSHIADAPTQTAEATEVTAPTQAAETTERIERSQTAEATEVTAPTQTAEATEATAPIQFVEATEATAPAQTAEATERIERSQTAEATEMFADQESGVGELEEADVAVMEESFGIWAKRLEVAVAAKEARVSVGLKALRDLCERVCSVDAEKPLPWRIWWPVGADVYGAQTLRSDADILCIGPSDLSREVFNSSVLAGIAGWEGVEEARVIWDARVPLLKLRMGEMQVDLLYARMPEAVEGAEMQAILEHLEPMIQRGVPIDIARALSLDAWDIASQRSLLGLLDGLFLRGVVARYGCQAVFTDLLRAIKCWAVQAGVHEQAKGYLGGMTWALLVAWLCTHPAAQKETRRTVLLRAFFATFGQCSWMHPIGITRIDKSMEEDHSAGLMPIYTPVSPQRNSARFVTPETFAFLRQAFRCGGESFAKRQQGKQTWEEWLGGMGSCVVADQAEG